MRSCPRLGSILSFITVVKGNTDFTIVLHSIRSNPLPSVTLPISFFIMPERALSITILIGFLLLELPLLMPLFFKLSNLRMSSSTRRFLSTATKRFVLCLMMWDSVSSSSLIYVICFLAAGKCIRSRDGSFFVSVCLT